MGARCCFIFFFFFFTFDSIRSTFELISNATNMNLIEYGYFIDIIGRYISSIATKTQQGMRNILKLAGERTALWAFTRACYSANSIVSINENCTQIIQFAPFFSQPIWLRCGHFALYSIRITLFIVWGNRFWFTCRTSCLVCCVLMLKCSFAMPNAQLIRSTDFILSVESFS